MDPFSDDRSFAGEAVIPVSALNRAIGRLLERNFPLAWVSGEVSNFTRAASGHWYFTIKDAQAQMRCVMFRNRAQHADFIPREGDRIEVRALVSMYEPRGELQLSVEAVRRTGQGQLYELFLKLKQKLEAEGLFDAARKRRPPPHPRRVGIVTSLQAAALRDVLTTLRRRAPHLGVIVYPAPVQGAGAGDRIAGMIETANRRAEVDVLILCRGGGSIEDLWAFNGEGLARAIAASAIPIVAGVGHETDFTIADFAADLRAPTPTGAAELVSPQRLVLLRDLDHRHAQLARAFGREMERRQQHLDHVSRRLVSPVERLDRQRAHVRQLGARLSAAAVRPVRAATAALALARLRWQRCEPDVAGQRRHVERLAARLAHGVSREQERRHARLGSLGQRIELLGPRQTLARGYAALIDPHSGAPLRSPAALKPGQALSIHLAEGAADVTLGDIQPRFDDSL
ncbi:MAG: exodeoxyribonuclease VII large subunit [Janthinobacterium lividum]